VVATAVGVKATIDDHSGRAAERSVSGVVDGWNQVGELDPVLRSRPGVHRDVFNRYREGTHPADRQMGLAPVSLAIIGGTVRIVGFLTVSTGAAGRGAGLQPVLRDRRRGADRIRPRHSSTCGSFAPATTAIALSATIGAGSTASVGAMRINEEIDALEVIGIRSTPTALPAG
jgi:phospholipid/cholesterol/gamma-HCH transport system permease protein